MSNQFPPLLLANWQPSLTSLQTYAQVIGKIRRALTPPHKHWYHVSLRVNATGLTTTPIPAPPTSFEMQLDLTRHALIVNTNRGAQSVQPLQGQSPATFCEQALGVLAQWDIHPAIDRSLFVDNAPGEYDARAVYNYFQALSQIDALLNQFKGELRQETSPVQLWPHHIDLAMLWFSGRLVPGQDPANAEYADEQMNFGFSPGDNSIPEAYFYITAYPLPDGLTDTKLPPDAMWQTTGFTGAVLLYNTLVQTDDPANKLLTFLRTVQQAGAALMR